MTDFWRGGLTPAAERELDRYGERDESAREARGVLPRISDRRSQPGPSDDRARDDRCGVAARLSRRRRRVCAPDANGGADPDFSRQSAAPGHPRRREAAAALSARAVLDRVRPEAVLETTAGGSSGVVGAARSFEPSRAWIGLDPAVTHPPRGWPGQARTSPAMTFQSCYDQQLTRYAPTTIFCWKPEYRLHWFHDGP